MNALLFSVVFILGTLVTTTGAMAEPFVPASNDSIIATWPVQDVAPLSDDKVNSLAQAIKISEELLERAAQPGRSYLYGLARTTISPWLSSIQDNSDNYTANNSARLWVVWARIQQQQHDFDSALSSLKRALELEPANINAHLITARIQVILRRFAQAEQSCSQLLATNNLLVASICDLEVASHQGQLVESYDRLKRILVSLPDAGSTKAWVLANLADMAVRQQLWQEAEQWSEAAYSDSDISVIIEWADVKLQLEKYQEVDDRLATLVARTPSVEDAILIRLALAEKNLELNANAPWLEQVTERVALREQRADLYHANDLATYYLDLVPNAEKALYWAQLNWEQAQEYKDQLLLDRARLAIKQGG